MTRRLTLPDGRSTAILFLHGYFGVFPRRFYWRHCRPLFAELQAAGFRVVVPSEPPTGTIERRALKTAKLMAKLPQEQIVLVGHSMGGLDARGIAAHLDPDKRVIAVVTLGTPHRGSSLAHWAMYAPTWPARLARLFDRGALIDLTPEAAAAFNEQVPDRDDVRYTAVVAQRPVAELARVLTPYGRMLAAEEGPNDGMVCVASARWGTRPIKLRADHFELIGWSLPPQEPELGRPFDHLDGLRQALAQAMRV